jgi:hypothetical protein
MTVAPAEAGAVIFDRPELANFSARLVDCDTRQYHPGMRLGIGHIMLMIVAIVAASSATACPPPPLPPPRLPGETDEAYAGRLEQLQAADRVRYRAGLAEWQAASWQKSSAIFVGRIEAARTVRLPFRTVSGDTSQKVKVRPVSWLRGKASNQPIWVRHSGVTTCGPFGGGDAVNGKPGDTFLFLIGPEGHGPHRIIDSIGRDRAEDPRVIGALVQQ